MTTKTSHREIPQTRATTQSNFCYLIFFLMLKKKIKKILKVRLFLDSNKEPTTGLKSHEKLWKDNSCYAESSHKAGTQQLPVCSEPDWHKSCKHFRRHGRTRGHWKMWHIAKCWWMRRHSWQWKKQQRRIVCGYWRDINHGNNNSKINQAKSFSFLTWRCDGEYHSWLPE